MAAEFPQLDVVASIEGRDDPALIRKLLPKTFKTYPDICGVYSSAAGNQGLIQFLKNSGRAQDLVIVAHELTESSRAALEDGAFDAIISQDSGHLIRSATRVLKATADRLPIDMGRRLRVQGCAGTELGFAVIRPRDRSDQHTFRASLLPSIPLMTRPLTGLPIRPCITT